MFVCLYHYIISFLKLMFSIFLSRRGKLLKTQNKLRYKQTKNINDIFQYHPREIMDSSDCKTFKIVD